MFFKNKQILHDQKTFEMGLNISDNLRMIAREKVIYSCFTNYLESKKLYDLTQDRDNVPLSLTTSTGDFQKTISLIDNQEEYEYTLITFEKTHGLVKEVLGQYLGSQALNNIGTGNLGGYVEKILLEKESELEKRIMDKNVPLREKLMTTSVYPSKIFKRFDFFKDKILTFEEYIELVSKNNYFEKVDVSVAEDILKSVFNKEEEN